MIRRTLPGARFFVDIARRATLCHGLTGKDQVDTQTRIAAKTCSTIVPPTKGFFWLIELTKDISEAELKKGG